MIWLKLDSQFARLLFGAILDDAVAQVTSELLLARLRIDMTYICALSCVFLVHRLEQGVVADWLVRCAVSCQ